MGLFDSLLKKKRDEKVVSRSENKPDHKSLIGLKAKSLIEELVSPLSKPNQKLIDEVLTIITQTSQLPDSMVNKEEVQKITKKLLFELVEPISNPNKQLIDELIHLINLSGKQDYKEVKEGYIVEDRKEELKEEVKEESSTKQSSESSEKERIIKGHAGLKQRQMQAIAQAPFPSEIQQVNKSKDRETKSIMNLLLEQIKELITITNGLNSKLKTHQVRLESIDSSIREIKKKEQDFDERMIAFEKNMEKFIGLYEVVTNQYNPFVETSDAFSDKQEFTKKDYNNRETDDKNYETKDYDNNTTNEENVNESKKNNLIISGKIIETLEDFSDSLIFMSDEDFKDKIINKKEEIFNWLHSKINNDSLKDELSNFNTRSDWIKLIIKNQN